MGAGRDLAMVLGAAAVVLEVAVAELANEVHARAPPITQDSAKRDS